MRTCRWCAIAVPDTTEHSRNWQCPRCRRWDAVACLVCGTTDGFPRNSTLLGTNVLVKMPHLRNVQDQQREIELCSRKITVYCDVHYHEAFFVDEISDTRSCAVCRTSWDRREAAQHPKVT